MIPEDRNVVTVDQFTVSKLHYSGSRGFWDEQPNRFELVYPINGYVKITEDYEPTYEDLMRAANPPSGGFMVWIEPHNNYLNAQIVYNWVVSNFALRGAAILWDLADNPEPGYCVWVGSIERSGDGWMTDYKEMVG